MKEKRDDARGPNAHHSGGVCQTGSYFNDSKVTETSLKRLGLACLSGSLGLPAMVCESSSAISDGGNQRDCLVDQDHNRRVRNKVMSQLSCFVGSHMNSGPSEGTLSRLSLAAHKSLRDIRDMSTTDLPGTQTADESKARETETHLVKVSPTGGGDRLRRAGMDLWKTCGTVCHTHGLQLCVADELAEIAKGIPKDMFVNDQAQQAVADTAKLAKRENSSESLSPMDQSTLEALIRLHQVQIRRRKKQLFVDQGSQDTQRTITQTLIDDRERAEERLKDLETEVAAKASEVNRKLNDLHNLEVRMAEIDESVQTLSQKKKTIESAVEVAAERVHCLSGEETALRNEIESLKRDKERLQDAYEKAKPDAQALQESITSLTAQKSDLNATVEELIEKSQKIQMAIEELEAKKQRFTDQASHLESAARYWENQFATKQSEAEAIIKRVASDSEGKTRLEKSIQNLVLEHRSLSKEKKLLTAGVEALRNKEEQIKGRMKEAAIKEQVEEKLMNLTEELRMSKETLLEVQKKLNETNKSLIEERANQKALATKRNSIDLLETKLQRLRKDIVSLKNTKRNLTETLKNFEQQIEEKQKAQTTRPSWFL